MARSRNIKPGFFENEVLAECGPWARLCFAGLWTLADREGRLEDRPKRIKGELFRFDAIEVEPLLDELAAHGFLLRYRNNEGAFIQILAFAKHQSPHYSERPSSIKPPGLQESSRSSEATYDDEIPGVVLEDSRSVPGVDQEDTERTPGFTPSLRGGRNPLIPDSGFLIPDSGFLIPDEDSGSPRCVDPPTPPPDFDGENETELNGKAIVRLSVEWGLPESWGLDAEALGWQPREVIREAEKFRQYWTSGKGKGTRRGVKGWRQAWSNWLQKAAEAKR